MHRTLVEVELRVNFIPGKLWRCIGMAVYTGTAFYCVAFVGNGLGVIVAQHLVYGLSFVDMTVETVRNFFVQIACRLTVEGLPVRKYGL